MEKHMKKRKTRTGIAVMALLCCAGTTVLQGFAPLAPNTVYAQENETQNMSQDQIKTVINEATTWNYLDNNTDPAAGLSSLTAWTEKGFNDSTWTKKAGKFGAKKGALVSFDGVTPTVLLQQYKPGQTGSGIPTYFFRTTFSISEIDKLSAITGKLYHDDAAAVYLNGHKILSVDMPAEVTDTNMYYAGVGAGAPKEAAVNLTKEQIQQWAVEGDNVLAIELHNDRETSSDIYFEFKNLELDYNQQQQPDSVTQKSVILTMGSKETQKNITWYADTAEAGEIQYAPKAAGENGAFPQTYATASAVSSAANDNGFYSNQATMENLASDTEYVYRLKNGETISDTYSFSTGTMDGAFSFALVGDPQIGTGNLQNGIDGWNKTMDVITSKLDPDFIVSAGDQVNTASNETEYEGYLNTELTGIASASTVGNHDSGSNAYGQHFNLPNESADKGITNAGSDYWFVYNNTLFMDINSNNRSTAEHKAFLEEAIAANPDVKWKTVIFHHSIYSTASHVDDSDIITRREELPQVFTDLDIDVVLMGHDHVYTRTYMMNGFTPDSSKGAQASTTDPEGILYLTANSASGSKYYDIKAADAEYAAKQDQSYRRTVTDIEVSDTSYTMTTYYADDMSVLDTFTINKTPDTDYTQLTELVKKAESLKEADYTTKSWKEFKTVYLTSKAVAENEEAAQDEVDQACTDLQSAMDGLELAKESQPDPKPGQNQNQTTVQITTQKKKATPKTGDTTNAAAAGILVVAAGSVIAVAVKKKKMI